MGGFIRTDTHTGNPQVEGIQPDELSPGVALTRLERKELGKKRKARSLKLAIMGIKLLDTCDPRYRNQIDMANAYRKRRSVELAEMHGHVSIGASALLASASLALAASRYVYELFGENAGGDIGIAMLKYAAQLGDSARQSELAAWEMSAREGLVKRKQSAMDQGVPWLAIQDGGRSQGGRPRNAQRQIDAVGVEAVPDLAESTS